MSLSSVIFNLLLSPSSEPFILIMFFSFIISLIWLFCLLLFAELFYSFFSIFLFLNFFDYWSIFNDDCFKILSFNFSMWFIFILAYIDYLFPFSLSFSWFLGEWVFFFFYCCPGYFGYYVMRPCMLLKSSILASTHCLGLAYRSWPTLVGYSSNDHLLSRALTVLLCFALCSTWKLFQKVGFYGIIHFSNLFAYEFWSAWYVDWFCYVMVLCRTSYTGLINSCLQLSPSGSSFYSTLLG